MKVKNNSKVPITIGHITIAPDQVEEIDDTLLYQPRVQGLRACADLIFPFDTEERAAAQVEPPAPVAPEPTPKRVVLDIHTDVPAPKDEVVTEEKPSFRKRK